MASPSTQPPLSSLTKNAISVGGPSSSTRQAIKPVTAVSLLSASNRACSFPDSLKKLRYLRPRITPINDGYDERLHNRRIPDPPCKPMGTGVEPLSPTALRNLGFTKRPPNEFCSSAGPTGRCHQTHELPAREVSLINSVVFWDNRDTVGGNYSRRLAEMVCAIGS